jgi:hypothetical protein
VGNFGFGVGCVVHENLTGHHDLELVEAYRTISISIAFTHNSFNFCLFHAQEVECGLSEFGIGGIIASLLILYGLRCEQKLQVVERDLSITIDVA